MGLLNFFRSAPPQVSPVAYKKDAKLIASRIWIRVRIMAGGAVLVDVLPTREICCRFSFREARVSGFCNMSYCSLFCANFMQIFC